MGPRITGGNPAISPLGSCLRRNDDYMGPRIMGGNPAISPLGSCLRRNDGYMGPRIMGGNPAISPLGSCLRRNDDYMEPRITGAPITFVQGSSRGEGRSRLPSTVDGCTLVYFLTAGEVIRRICAAR